MSPRQNATPKSQKVSVDSASLSVQSLGSQPLSCVASAESPTGLVCPSGASPFSSGVSTRKNQTSGSIPPRDSAANARYATRQLNSAIKKPDRGTNTSPPPLAPTSAMPIAKPLL